MLSFIYLRHGLISVLVAHYVFDVFWSGASYFLGKVNPFDFYTSLGVLLLPFFLGIGAYCANRPQTERPMRWHLNKHQLYNIEILKTYFKDRTIQERDTFRLKEELVSHGWDAAVIDALIEDITRQNTKGLPEK